METRKKSPTDYKTLHSIGTTQVSDGEISPGLSDDRTENQASDDLQRFTFEPISQGADSAAADSDEENSGEENELRRLVSCLTDKRDSLASGHKLKQQQEKAKRKADLLLQVECLSKELSQLEDTECGYEEQAEPPVEWLPPRSSKPQPRKAGKLRQKKTVQFPHSGFTTTVDAQKDQTGDGRPRTGQKTSGRPDKGTSMVNSDNININALRSSEPLREEVANRMRKYELLDLADSESSDNDPDIQDPYESLFSQLYNKSEGRYRKQSKVKSGLFASASQKVKYPQEAPHCHLQFEYVGRELRFTDLDLRLFVAGELEIITKCLNSAEREARLGLLKKITYLAGIYEWKAVRNFYAALIRKIEIGENKWGDNFSELETPMLTTHVALPPTGRGKGPACQFTVSNSGSLVFYCAAYQANRCTLNSPHDATISGEKRQVGHFCSVCWRRDRTQSVHPDSSSACPYKD